MGEGITTTKQSTFPKICSCYKKPFLPFHRIFSPFILKSPPHYLSPKNWLAKIERYSGFWFWNYPSWDKGQQCLRSTWSESMRCSWADLELGCAPQLWRNSRMKQGTYLSKCRSGIANRGLLRLSVHPHAQKRAPEATPTSLDWAYIQN